LAYFLELVSAPAGRYNGRAVPGESNCQRAPNAGRSAENDRDTTGDIKNVLHR
jgi:hypothetical protein